MNDQEFVEVMQDSPDLAKTTARLVWAVIGLVVGLPTLSLLAFVGLSYCHLLR